MDVYTVYIYVYVWVELLQRLPAWYLAKKNGGLLYADHPTQWINILICTNPILGYSICTIHNRIITSISKYPMQNPQLSVMFKSPQRQRLQRENDQALAALLLVVAAPDLLGRGPCPTEVAQRRMAIERLKALALLATASGLGQVQRVQWMVTSDLSMDWLKEK